MVLSLIAELFPLLTSPIFRPGFRNAGVKNNPTRPPDERLAGGLRPILRRRLSRSADVVGDGARNRHGAAMSMIQEGRRPGEHSSWRRWVRTFSHGHRQQSQRFCALRVDLGRLHNPASRGYSKGASRLPTVVNAPRNTWGGVKGPPLAGVPLGRPG